MGFFTRKRKPLPPYDTLPEEQRYALYYLLEYLATEGVPIHQMSWANSYLEKAAIYFGMTKSQTKEFKPLYNSYEKITSYIKQITNRQILEYMISNCSNLFVLMDDSEVRKALGAQAYTLYFELGFDYDDVRYITHKYQYRVEI